MTTRILRRYPHYDLIADGRRRLYANKSGVPIAVQTQRGRRPQVIKVIEEAGICPVKARPEDETCTVGRDVDGQWWAWGPSSRAGVRVIDGRELESHGNE